MQFRRNFNRNGQARLWAAMLYLFAVTAAWTAPGGPTAFPLATILELSGDVRIARTASAIFDLAYTNQVLYSGDRGRTGPEGRATLQFSSRKILRVDGRSRFEITAPVETRGSLIFNLWQGAVYLFSRDDPRAVLFRSRTASAATRGTEFNLEVDDASGRMVLTLLEGAAVLSNDFGSTNLVSGEQGVAEPGRPPSKTALLNAINVIQWALYYPAILNVDELALTAPERALLAASLEQYRRGDLLSALESYPVDRQPVTAAEKTYRAAILLAAGEIAEAEPLLVEVDTQARADAATPFLARALRQLIAVVKNEIYPTRRTPVTATEWLAESYQLQAGGQLAPALHAAQAALRIAPDFSYARVRVAELEFGFGHSTRAREQIELALRLAPRHAHAHVVQGFLLAAQDDIPAALGSFERAIALDGALAPAWLGRGLCRIRRGQAELGRQDLQVAAALEPQRSIYRSYLGKAFAHEGDLTRAAHELGLARRADPADPTPSLYAALLNQERNRINEAIADLERSQSLNDHRLLFRSRLLLDQDKAVRGINLANIYRDAGMLDVGLREAVRAVNADYGNYATHLFLANTFNELRDPRQVNLRYDTPWFSEFLVANLLAPVGAGTLSQAVSQQEYSKLFEQDRLGFFSRTDYLSRGEWFQTAVQHGVMGGSSYAAEAFYHSASGHRPNNDLEQLALNLRLKQELTPEDKLFFQLGYYNATSGDVNQYYRQSSANPSIRIRETQEPTLLAGYHHQWRPGIHTLVLAGRIDDDLQVDNPNSSFIRLLRNPFPLPPAVAPIAAQQTYRSQFTLYSAEAQQIWQSEKQALIAGGRYQYGQFDVDTTLDTVQPQIPFVSQSVAVPMERVGVYLYEQWHVADPLWLIGGVSYDWVTFPENFRFAPIARDRERVSQLSPKGGLLWNPAENTTIRFGYAQVLGGVSLDQSYQLEPSQVAGFTQSYRGVIPEAVAGVNAAPRIETIGLSLEHRFPTRTYVGVSGELLSSDVERTRGALERLEPVPGNPTVYRPARLEEHLDFRERSVLMTVHQLLGARWSVGLRYRYSEADLNTKFTDLPANATFPNGFLSAEDHSASLQQLNLFAIYNHPCGFFAQADTLWNSQHNRDSVGSQPGDDFWQINVHVGYRLLRRRAEVQVGLLNLTDQDYRLNPLNLTSELPRERTVALSLKLNF